MNERTAGAALLVIGVVVLGIKVARNRLLPSWAGIGMAAGIVVYTSRAMKGVEAA